VNFEEITEKETNRNELLRCNYFSALRQKYFKMNFFKRRRRGRERERKEGDREKERERE